MRWMAVGVSLILLAGCAAQVVSATPRSISIKKNELSGGPTRLAREHCESFGKKARLAAVEPVTFGSQIYHFDCI